ncbi:MAG: sulfotransferase family protein [Elusimicrobiota bacterium]
MNSKVDIFYIGPPKTASTWIYNCLKEHPEICAPIKDTVHYFDMHYVKGKEWYLKHFNACLKKQKLCDVTTSYMHSPQAPKRIFQHNPDAKIIICMRNPLDRAFSHYWHEKKKLNFNFEFREVLENYDLYSSWLEPGFYGEYIERYLKFFPREQILCQLFEDLEVNPGSFLNRLYEFIGVEADFKPSVIYEKCNAAKRKETFLNLHITSRISKFVKKYVPFLGKEKVIKKYLSGKAEYYEGIPNDLYNSLLKICIPEIEKTENLLGIDLSQWKNSDRD